MPTRREAAAVEEWLRSEKWLHAMRDNPYHWQADNDDDDDDDDVAGADGNDDDDDDNDDDLCHA